MCGDGMAGLGRNGCPGLDSSTANTGSMSAARAIDLGQRRELRRAEQRSRRRRRTLPGGTEREGGREEVGEPHYLGAKLLDGSRTAGSNMEKHRGFFAKMAWLTGHGWVDLD